MAKKLHDTSHAKEAAKVLHEGFANGIETGVLVASDFVDVAHSIKEFWEKPSWGNAGRTGLAALPFVTSKMGKADEFLESGGSLKNRMGDPEDAARKAQTDPVYGGSPAPRRMFSYTSSTGLKVTEIDGVPVKWEYTVGTKGIRGNRYKSIEVGSGLERGHVKAVREGAGVNAIDDGPRNIIEQTSQ